MGEFRILLEEEFKRFKSQFLAWFYAVDLVPPKPSFLGGMNFVTPQFFTDEQKSKFSREQVGDELRHASAAEGEVGVQDTNKGHLRGNPKACCTVM